MTATIAPIGALRQWHRELARGYGGQRAEAPSTWRLNDPVYRAACAEAHGNDALRDGRPHAAAEHFHRAAAIIVAAQEPPRDRTL